MPPFKRTSAKFTGETDSNGHGLMRINGSTVEITGKAKDTDASDDLWTIRGRDGNAYVVEGDDLQPHPEERPTNVEYMAHAMEWASSPLVHVFMFDAITKFADQVLEDPDAVREQMKNHFVSGDAWLAAAKEAKEIVDAHLKR